MNQAKERMVNTSVRAVIDNYPAAAKEKFFQLRELIYAIASEDDAIGELTETTKWGEPSYLTSHPKSGTTIRLSWSSKWADKFIVSVHCQSRLIDDFRQIYSELEYDGNRSIFLSLKSPLPKKAVEHFIYLALTYHARK